MSIDLLAAALPAVPLAAALVGLLLPMRSRRLPAILAIGGAGTALVLAIAMVIRGPVETAEGVTIAEFGDLAVTFTTWADGTAGLVAVAVGIVATCVQVYSVAYLHDDDRYAPYAAQISLFTSAMLLVVVAGDLIPLVVGWEIMGLCSYLLIGHDRKLPEAPGAAVKAFIVTRTGDVGFILGVAILGTQAGSFRISDVLTHHYSAATLTAAGVLLLCGVAGKSAQFPLHTWLPDAMAGPTPISALIHAATMVAAGVYLVARLFPIFNGTALAVLAISASITMLLGAATAMAQQDIKKVLAWSTVSQLGYMAGALAVGSRGPALLHLLSHAGFKALLFLGSGALIHAVGSNLMTAMGGMRRSMPTTYITMTIGLAALVGLPPLAGFVSKDTILAAAHHAVSAPGEVTAGHEAGALAAGAAPLWAAWLVWIAGLVTTGLTGWYATRLWLRTFFGASAARHPHEPSWLMRGPLLVLAVPSALLGLVALAPFIAERLGMETPEPFETEALAPLALATLGSLVSWYTWRRTSGADPILVVPGRRVLVAAFGVDSAIDVLVVRPVHALARAVKRADELLVDGAVRGTGKGTVALGTLLGSAHRAGLPRAATAVLSGALLIAVAIAVGVGQ
ncbi:MAG: NADH-quinone oxidoreductase subunit L [Dactylosporangium sp.]|nr:NADH-quinone oxidoreductase subunit L [Dactylosporangium sp.]NNJ61455.1 NADH-quinone oxidoreductase subunit L [Dactylosporangium sp.]